MVEKSCFVVMPIRKPGSADHAHFRAVFNQIRPVAERMGYSVVRADDIQKSGAITRDIVTRLGESDLVVADLTDLNPNVYYELGIRHALKGSGTLMILDEIRTPEIPFDVSAYRVIKFSGDLAGIEPLVQALESFFCEYEKGAEDAHSDNPVHDWFPTLPSNVLDSSAESDVAPLRRTIKQLQDRLAQYEKAYGGDLPSIASEKTPLSKVLAALSDAEDGLLPATVMEEAGKAFEARDEVAFLRKIRVVIERNVRLPSTMFIRLGRWAAVLDLREAVFAIFDQALEFYPTDSNLKLDYLNVLAHSDSPADRERARKEIPRELSIDLSADQVAVTRPERLDRDLELVSLLLDAYQRDEAYEDELAVAEKVRVVLPDNSIILRLFARALENNGRAGDAMHYYREAILARDVDDVSAMWLGNELHNRRQHREAAEAYAYGCLLDPSDGANFSHLTEELAIYVSEWETRVGSSEASDGIALDVTSDMILNTASCAASCDNVDVLTVDRLRRAFQHLELDVSSIGEGLSKAARKEHAKAIYDVLKTDLTTKGKPYDFDV